MNSDEYTKIYAMQLRQYFQAILTLNICSHIFVKEIS